MAGLARRLAAPIAARLLKRLTGLPPSVLDPKVRHGSAAMRAYAPTQAPALLERTGFLLHTPELLNHFNCVMELLPRGSFDLVVCRDADGSEEVKHTASRLKAKVYTVGDVLSSGKRYECLVSNHPVMLGDPALLKHVGATNVRFMYAAGKSGWNFGDWNSLYDLILCYGPYHADEFAKRTDAVVVQMGYPRMDRYFNELSDLEELKKRFSCDPSKRTVVWLPTWKALSSVGLFDGQVAALTAKYNVIVKVHPLMPGDEPDRVTRLKQHTFTCLITDASDNLPLYKVADFMLFDYGGPPFAGLYTDKRMLLLNVPDAARDQLAGADSPDIALRRTIASIDARSGDIAQLLDNEGLWEQQRKQRADLRKLYFAPYYGFSARVAALTLSNVNHIVASRGRA